MRRDRPLPAGLSARPARGSRAPLGSIAPSDRGSARTGGGPCSVGSTRCKASCRACRARRSRLLAVPCGTPSTRARSIVDRSSPVVQLQHDLQLQRDLAKGREQPTLLLLASHDRRGRRTQGLGRHGRDRLPPGTSPSGEVIVEPMPGHPEQVGLERAVLADPVAPFHAAEHRQLHQIADVPPRPCWRRTDTSYESRSVAAAGQPPGRPGARPKAARSRGPWTQCVMLTTRDDDASMKPEDRPRARPRSTPSAVPGQRPPERLFDEAPSPTRVGRFVLLDRLGAGGMGAVYSAFDPQLDRRVAIKVLHGGGRWRWRAVPRQ